MDDRFSAVLVWASFSFVLSSGAMSLVRIHYQGVAFWDFNGKAETVT